MSNEFKISDATIVAYINKELSVEEMVKVDRWMAASADNMKKFNEIHKAWELSGGVKIKPVDVDADKAWEKVSGRIQNNENGGVIAIQNRRNLVVKIAAALILLIGISAVLFYTVLPQKTKEQLELVADSTPVKEQLSDGSSVTLNKNSVLSYPPEFSSSERKVKLSGEAFFEVERNENKPFIIELKNQAKVQVLGTSFNISSKDNDSITHVFVQSGKVAFTSEVDSVVLNASSKAIMDNQTGKIRKVKSNIGGADIFWLENKLLFDNDPLTSVVEVLNHVFDDEVEIRCDDVNDMRVVSQHQNESLEEILEVITEIHQLEVSKIKLESGRNKYVLNCND